jgi:predicted ABC-type ATPase
MIVIAGPNGSGKSTIIDALRKEVAFPACYINADEIAKSLRSPYPEKEILQDCEAIANHCDNRFDADTVMEHLRAGVLNDDTRNHYAAILAEIRRRRAIRQRKSFAFETVMSTPAKLALLNAASKAGYHVDLVFITTQNPRINELRVNNRVQSGGHPVETAKIFERYHRAMELLPSALDLAHTARVYDNSYGHQILIFEKKNQSHHFPSVDHLRTLDRGTLEKLNEWIENKVHSQVKKRITQRKKIFSMYPGQEILLADITHNSSTNGHVTNISEPFLVQKLKKHKQHKMHLSSKSRSNQARENRYLIHDIKLIKLDASSQPDSHLNSGLRVSIKYRYNESGRLVPPCCIALGESQS